MTTRAIDWHVRNSLIFISDPESEDTPEVDGIGGLWMTPECIAVGCLPDSDGPTKIILGPVKEVGTHNKLVFDGTVLTPNRKLSVGTVLAETLLESAVPDTVTHLRIWTNGNRDSDIVVIGFN